MATFALKQLRSVYYRVYLLVREERVSLILYYYFLLVLPKLRRMEEQSDSPRQPYGKIDNSEQSTDPQPLFSSADVNQRANR